MKVFLLLSFLSLSGLLAADTAAPPQKDAKQLLQEGLFEEEANRDFKKAGEAYAAVIAQFDGQRSLIATSLFRYAEVKSKEGDKAAAIALYQRLLRDFSTEEALVKLARERLAALGEKEDGPGGGPATTDEETKAIAEFRKWVDESPDRLKQDGSEIPLLNTIGKGWLRATTFLLDHGVKIEPVAVVAAAAGGRKALLELLLDRGANPNAADGSHLPLETACRNNCTEVVRLLLEKGAQPNASVRDESTPLIASIRNPEITALLLDHGADPNLPDQRTKITPLIAASTSAEVTKLLRQHRADPNLAMSGPQAEHILTTPLFKAIWDKQEATVELLLAAKANPNEASEPLGEGTKLTPLEAALDKSMPTLISALVQAGADPNARDPLGTTALEMATERGSLELVNALLAAHADPNSRDADGNTALHYAAGKIGYPADSYQSYAILASVVASGQPLSNQALEIKKKALEIAKRLLEAGADPRIQNENGADALHVSISRYLLQPRTDENSPNFRPGARPIPRPVNQLAPSQPPVRRPAPRIVTPSPTPTPIETPQPVPSDADPGAPDYLTEFWSLLLAKGANLNAANKAGVTPLHEALHSDSCTLEQAEWLIDQGADLTALDHEKKSPLSGVDREKQLAIAKKYLFPKWTEMHAISVMLPGSASPEKTTTFPALTEFDTPPDGIDLLLDVINPGRIGPEHALVSSGSYNYAITIHRRDPSGRIAEIGQIGYSSSSAETRTWPALQWGDVLVVDIDQPDYGHREVNISDQTNRLGHKITVEIGDQIHPLNLALSRDASFWSGTADSWPEWRLSELAERLLAANPRIRLDQVKLERSSEGMKHEWTIDLRGEGRPGAVKPLLANLLDGDHLTFLQASSSETNGVELRKNRITELAPGGWLGVVAYTRDQDSEARPHTICQLVADVYCTGPMLIPNPDFAHIMIHRLKNDSGELEDITVDLAGMAAKAAQNAETDSAKDVELKWGDVVEIPTLRVLNERSWSQLDLGTVTLLSAALRRNADVQLPHGALFPVAWTPLFGIFSWAWNGEIPKRDKTVTAQGITGRADSRTRAETIGEALRLTHVDLGELSRIDVHSGDKVRQISIDELRKSDPKFLNGDVIEPVLR